MCVVGCWDYYVVQAFLVADTELSKRLRLSVGPSVVPSVGLYHKIKSGKTSFLRVNGNSRKSVRWSAVPVAPMWVYVGVWWWEGRWPMLSKFCSSDWIWASIMGFEPQSCDLSHDTVIWASRLWFEPRGCDLSLQAMIWGFRLGFEALG